MPNLLQSKWSLWAQKYFHNFSTMSFCQFPLIFHKKWPTVICSWSNNPTPFSTECRPHLPPSLFITKAKQFESYLSSSPHPAALNQCCGISHPLVHGNILRAEGWVWQNWQKYLGTECPQVCRRLSHKAGRVCAGPSAKLKQGAFPEQHTRNSTASPLQLLYQHELQAALSYGRSEKSEASASITHDKSDRRSWGQQKTDGVQQGILLYQNNYKGKNCFSTAWLRN